MESPAATSSVQPHSSPGTPAAGGGVGGAGGGSYRPPAQHKHPRPADLCRVVVTGYPPYVQPQDLRHAFAAVGDAVVEKLDDKTACLLFPSHQQATAAVQLSNKAIVYGEFVTVREYNAAGTSGAEAGAGPAAVGGQNTTPKSLNKRLTINKRDFPRSKEKDDGIISPEQLDLNGDFCRQLDNLLAAVRLTEHEAAALANLYADVQAVICQHIPGCVAMPFGSVTTGLGIKTSDADCYVQLPIEQRHLAHNIVNKAKRILQQHPQVFAELLCIPRANTPIVKFHHLPTNTNCDLSFKTPLGYRNSLLIAHLLHADPRLIPLAVTIKYWAKVHQLTGTGRLSNYALTMCIIFYLQCIHILPSVVSLQTDRHNDVVVDHWNTGFDTRPIPRTDNTTPLSDLIGGFFVFYATFQWDQHVVCPYLGAPLPRDMFRGDVSTLPAEYALYASNVRAEVVYPIRGHTAMCVQDPIELSHNVASAVTTRLLHDVTAYIQHAAAAYTAHRPTRCQGLLAAILRHKPHIQRPKQHPEYRAILQHRVIQAMPQVQWKASVTRILMYIFEELLMMPLTVHTVTTNTTATAPNPKRERERYRGVVTAPVWKRKQFTNVYKHVVMEFARKQRRITEEIVNVNKAALKVPYTLTVTYAESRHCTVSVRNLDGDVDTFRQFGTFLVNTLSQWFSQVLRDTITLHGHTPAVSAHNGDNDNDTSHVGDDDDSVDYSDDDTAADLCSTAHTAADPCSTAHTAADPCSTAHTAADPCSTAHTAADPCSTAHTAADPCSTAHTAADPCSTAHTAADPCSTAHTAADPCSTAHTAADPCSTAHTAADPCSTAHTAADPCSTAHTAADPCSTAHTAADPCSTAHTAADPCSTAHTAADPCSTAHTAADPCSTAHTAADPCSTLM